MRAIVFALLISAAPAAVLAQETGPVFDLGELQITARDRDNAEIGGTTLSEDTVWTFGKDNLAAALDLAPGVGMSNTGGSRNERLIFVRGFDRFQTSLSIDGIRVYLPADNRIDFGRFLTADLSEIQIAKGYVPVIDGPGALGGAINLVTRRPVKALEAEFRGVSTFDNDFNAAAYQVSGLLGTRQGPFYAQVSGAYNDRDYFTLSGDFSSTALEDGGERDRTATRDWRTNIKTGWTPREGDEYSLNYTQQSGEKNAPLHVSDAANSRFWSWPYWNLSSLYFLSKTQLTEQLTLRSRLYANGFENLLSAYDNAAQITQLLPRAFNSYYDDEATGGNLELDWAVSDTHVVKGAFYLRTDEHRERQDGNVRTPATGNPSANRPYSEPWQTTEESTYSVALENRMGIGGDVDLTIAASYDWTDLKRAEEVNVQVTGTTIANAQIKFLPVSFPLNNDQAFNIQAAVVWRMDDTLSWRATVSSRSRFPSIFERFSARMGTAIPNPDVKSERAVSYEIGIDKAFGDKVQLEGAVFYSDLSDALIQIPVSIPGFGIVNQTKNAAQGRYSGAEASLTAQLTNSFAIGGNYTYLDRELTDPTNPLYQPTGVPEHRAFLYATWEPLESLAVTPSLELASRRWTTAPIVPAPAAPAPNVRFYELGDFTLLNLNVDWAVNSRITASAGGQNLMDKDYSLTDGFPEAGRSLYARLRVRY